MKKIFLGVIILLALSITDVSAVPAYPRKVGVYIDGDTLFIQMKGDENCKFAIDENGYTLLSTEQGWFYATEDESGFATVSSHRFVPKHIQSDETKRFLQQTRKGIIPKINTSSTYKSSSIDSCEIIKAPATGFRKVLVILMQFKDKKFTKEATDFQKLFNEENYREDGAIGSVYDYYKWSSYGQLNLYSDVMGPYTSKHEMSYYGGNSSVGGNDKNPYALFEEAVNEVIKEIDLSEYDANGDGYVDNIHIIYAGYGEEAGASSKSIWAHEMTFNAISIQGMKIDKYSCAPELRGNRGTGISRIGPHCHEIGHALGAMDYYDTDYETGGNYLGTGDWDIMASGSWNNEGISPAGFNPYVKVYDFGWTDVLSLQPDVTNTIKQSTEKGQVYRIDTGTKNDFFLLENRGGTDFNGAEPGAGLLIFHIGPNLETKAASNKINAGYPQQCYIVCASSTYKKPSSSASTYGKINSSGCPYPGSSQNHEFSETSTPAALTVSGKTTGIRLTNIRLENGDINLFYGESQPSDTTITTEILSWEEDFEQMKMPSTWIYTNIVGLGEFTISRKLTNGDTPQSPAAASGRGFAKFNSTTQNGLGRHYTRGILVSPPIFLAAGKQYQIDLKCRKYAKLEDACDTIFVHLLDEDGNDITDPLIKYVDNQDAWGELTGVLPDGINEFSIGIECHIDYGTIMFVDDIEISEYRPGSSVKSLYFQESTPISIYSISGEEIPALQKGFNIIRDSNGNTYKIRIK